MPATVIPRLHTCYRKPCPAACCRMARRLRRGAKARVLLRNAMACLAIVASMAAYALA